MSNLKIKKQNQDVITRKSNSKTPVFSRIFKILVCLVAVFALCYFIVQLVNVQDYFLDETKQIALNDTTVQSNSLNQTVTGDIDDVQKVANEVKSITNHDQLQKIGDDYVKKNKALSMQFLCEGVPTYAFGKDVGSSSDAKVRNLIATNKTGSSGIYNDSSIGKPCVAIYVPIENNEEIDGVIAQFSAQSMSEIKLPKTKSFDFICMSKSDGIILNKTASDDFPDNVRTNIYDYIYKICANKNDADQVIYNIKNKISQSYKVIINGETYLLSCVPNESLGESCSVISLTSEKYVLDNNYPLYNNFFTCSIFLCIAIIVSILTLIFVNISSREKLNNLVEYDPIIGSNTFRMFNGESTKILSNAQIKHYVVVDFDVKKFAYLKSQFGEEFQINFLKYITNVVKKTLAVNETYARVSDDNFVMLLGFTGEQELYDRLNVLQMIISNYEDLKNKNTAITLAIGVCKCDDVVKNDINTMVDHASIAKVINRQSTQKLYDFYDESVDNTYNAEAEIEAKMEKALENNEFKLFFQPKYGFKKDGVDGAEVLVRWYSSETKSYVPPSKFVNLFEANGFIVNMDRYMLEKSFQFLNDCVANSIKTYPLSVNVSRVSAIQDDFLSFYIETKKKYNIPDNFITLEFTESFAIENNKTLIDIVNVLHQNGYKCSIDDFGNGYSTFSVLKDLPVDELKLDKVFLERSSNLNRDDLILKTIISLGNSFDIKVVQEGVETLDIWNKVKSFGCDVIQGYYYSKPLMMSDYIEFISRNTSFRSIAEFHNNQLGDSQNGKKQ